MLRLLGTLSVDGKPDAAVALPVKAYLAIALIDLRFHGVADRSELASLLWPTSMSTLANRSLRQMLLLARKWERLTGLRVFEIGARQIRRTSACLPSDAALLFRASAPVTEHAISELSDLYRGDFLASFDAETFDQRQWIEEQRDLLLKRFTRLALDATEVVPGGASEALLRRLSQYLPYDEEVHRALLKHLARERPAAVRPTFEGFADRLRADLSALPEIETRMLVAEFAPTMTLATAARTAQLLPFVQPASRPSVPRVLLLPPIAGRDVPAGTLELGMSFVDDLILSLSTIRTFAVFAPHTARQLVRGSPLKGTLPYAADYVLESRLVHMYGHVRLALALAHTASQEVLFAESVYFSKGHLSRQRTDLIALVLRHLTKSIERTELAEMRRTGEASAYVHYLLGTEQVRTLELKNVRRARKHFQRAVELSPGFASAISMVARTMCLEWVLLDRPESDLTTAALELASRAVRIEPFDPNGHRELGTAQLYLDRLDESVDHMEQAVERAPHHSDMLINYADVLLHSMRRLPKAKALVQTALELNPLAPDEYNWIGATVDFFLGDSREALSKLMRLGSKDAAARLIAAVAATAGEMEVATRYRDVFMARHPDFQIANWKMPMRGDRERQLYIDALRHAGFS